MPANSFIVSIALAGMGLYTQNSNQNILHYSLIVSFAIVSMGLHTKIRLYTKTKVMIFLHFRDDL